MKNILSVQLLCNKVGIVFLTVALLSIKDVTVSFYCVGKYFSDCKKTLPKAALDEKAAEELWVKSTQNGLIIVLSVVWFDTVLKLELVLAFFSFVT